jgi:hypothetical protein
MVNKQISNLFQAQGNSIASYNYTDIAEGTGMVEFYCFTSYEGGVKRYRLSTKQVYSNDVYNQRSSAGTTIMNFDLSAFNKPQTISGTAFVTAGIGRWDGQPTNVSITALVQKISGETTTSISSTITSEVSSLPEPHHKSLLLTIPLTTTHFKRGDILRLVIGHVQSEGSPAKSRLGHDPMNRATTYIDNTITPTILKFYCPFRLDEIGL